MDLYGKLPGSLIKQHLKAFGRDTSYCFGINILYEINILISSDSRDSEDLINRVRPIAAYLEWCHVICIYLNPYPYLINLLLTFYLHLVFRLIFLVWTAKVFESHGKYSLDF